ncbi:MAG: hypothetical protein JXR07_12265 [Reichenbachiella sp.]
MKKLLAFMMMGVAVFAMSCEDDADPIDTPDSETGADVVTVVGVAETFTDSDMEADSREWSVTPSAGVTLPGDLTGASVELTFTEAGNYTVTSTRMFGGSFTEPTNTLSYSVEVFDEVLAVVDMSASSGDFTFENGAKNVVTTGEAVSIENLSVGMPNSTVVSFTGDNAPADVTVDVGSLQEVVFTATGVYGMTVTATRTTPAGEDVASYTELIEVFAPLEVTASAVVDGTTISMTYSHDVDAATVTDAAASFTVDYQNFGVTGNLPVSAVAVSGDAANVIHLTVAEIYASDSLIIDYAAGAIKGLDGVVASEVTDHVLTQSEFGPVGFENMWIDEATGLQSWPHYQQNFHNDTFGNIYFTQDGRSFTVKDPWGTLTSTEEGTPMTDIYSGTAGAQMVNTLASDASPLLVGNGTVSIETGKDYHFSMKIKVLSAGVALAHSSANCDPAVDENECLEDAFITFFSAGFGGWGDLGSGKYLLKDLGSEWTTISFDISSAGDFNQNWWARTWGISDVLIDDIYLIEVEKR